jgi:hypothetical protein
MKLFFRKISIHFFVILFIISVLLYLGRTYTYPRTRIPNVKLNLFKENNKGYESLSIVLGSSHAFYGVDSRMIDNHCFNFASVSQSLMEDYHILKFLLVNKYSVEKVILPISYFSNWGYLYKTPIEGEQLRMFDYQSGYNVNYPNKFNIRNEINYLSKISNTLFRQTRDFELDNWGNLIGECKKSEVLISDAKTAFKRHNSNANFTIINPYLDSINELCIQQNATLIFVVMPFSEPYRKIVETTPFNVLLRKIKAKYSRKNCFLINQMIFFNTKEEAVMFRDADHLSFCGRNAFSMKLSSEINNMLKSN